MKWFTLVIFAALTSASLAASAQRAPIAPEIGNIPAIDNQSPVLWGMSGFELFTIRESDGSFTPAMRMATYDARLVEILSRTQAPPLRASDIRTWKQGSRNYVVVRNFILAEIKPQDARAEKTSTTRLAAEWAASARRVLPQVAPAPGRFGI